MFTMLFIKAVLIFWTGYFVMKYSGTVLLFLWYLIVPPRKEKKARAK
jgi:hypothetical protein